MRIRTADGRVGVVVDEQFLPKGTLWLLRIYWGHDFYSWVRCHDGKVPSIYKQMDGPKYPGCSDDERIDTCRDCMFKGHVYYESSKAIRAYRLSELSRDTHKGDA